MRAWPGLVDILNIAKELQWFCALAEAAGSGQPSVVWPCSQTVVLPSEGRLQLCLLLSHSHLVHTCQVSYILHAANVGEAIKGLQSLLLFLKRVRSQFDTCHCFFYVCSDFSALDILPF